MGPLARQVKQVVLTYATRRSLVFFAGLIGLIVVPGPIVASLSERVDHSRMAIHFLLAWPAGFAAFWLVDQAKRQFSQPQAHLVAGYTTPHLAILAVGALVVFVAFPWFVASCCNRSALGATSCILVFAALWIWALHFNRSLLLFLALGVFLSAMAERGEAFWYTPNSSLVFIHVLLIVTSLAAITAWLVRIANLQEEDPEYGMYPLSQQTIVKSRADQSAANTNVGRMLARGGLQAYVSDKWHDRLAGRRPEAWSKSELMRYGFTLVPVVYQVSLIAMMLCGMFTLMIYFFSSFMKDATAMVIAPAVMATLIPASMGGQLLMTRRRQSTELLLPMTRSEYCHRLLWACGANVFATWLSLTLVTLVILFIFRAQLDLPTSGVLPTSGIVAGFLVSIALQLPSAAAAFIAAGKSRSTLSYLGCIMGIYLVQLAIFLTSYGLALLVGVPVVCAVVLIALTLLGVWLLRRAHAFWMRLELG